MPLNSIRKGIRSEADRAFCHFSQSPHVKTFQRLFQRAHSSEKKALIKTILISEETRARFADSEELKALSCLREQGENDESLVDETTVKALYQYNSTKSLSPLLSHFDRIFTANEGDSPFNDSTRLSFEKAALRQEKISRLISEKKGSEFSINHNLDIETLASQFEEELSGQESGTPFIYFGELPNAQPLQTNGFVDAALNETLPKPLYDFLKGNNDDFTRKIQEQILETLESEDIIPKEISEVHELISRLTQKTNNLMKTIFPDSWVDKLADSLKEDFREMLLGKRSPEEKQKLAEFIWDKLQEKGVKKGLQDVIDKMISEAKKNITEEISQAIEEVGKEVPEGVVDALSALGMPLKNSNSRFWIEIIKQNDGKYSLMFYSQSLGSEIHPLMKSRGQSGHHLPIVFKDIKPEKLGKEFFFRLIACHAWPEWNLGVSYSLEEIFKELTLSLKTKPEAPSKKTFYLSSFPMSGRIADWLTLYAYHHSDLDQAQFQKVIAYDLPLETLIHFWPRVNKNPKILQDPTLRHALAEMIDRLSRSGSALFKDELITLEELKSLYGTIWEARETLKPFSVNSGTSSQVIPQEMQEVVKTLLLQFGFTNERIEFVKELFVSVLGKECEESFDTIIQEVVPSLEANHPESKSPSLPWDFIASTFEEMKTMRLSPLHMFRLLSRIAAVVSFVFCFTLKARLIENLLRKTCPQLGIYTGLGLKRMSQLLALFGPSFLSRWIPQEPFEIISASFGLVSEVVNYAKFRFGLLILKTISRQLIDDQLRGGLNHHLKSLQQMITRDGELSFDFEPEPLAIPVTLTLSKETPREESASPSIYCEDLPRPSDQVLTPAMLLNSLKTWYVETCFLKTVGRFREAELYLNAQLRNLPIPGQKGGDIWEQAENPQELLEVIHSLFCLIHRFQSLQKTSYHEHVERVTSIYSLYAIVDTLARQCEEAQIPPHLKANGAELAHWMGMPTCKFVLPKTYDKFKEVAAYFDLDPSKKYTRSEITEYLQKRLFHFSNSRHLKFSRDLIDEGKISELSLFYSNEMEYFYQLLENEAVQRKLKALGYEKASDRKKVSLLFCDPSLKCQLENISDRSPEELAEIEEAFSYETHDQDLRKGLLPRPYYFLRLIHLMAVSSFKGNDKSDFFSNDWQETGLKIKIKEVDDLFPESWFLASQVNTLYRFTRRRGIQSNLKFPEAPDREIRPNFFNRRDPDVTRGYHAGVGVISNIEYFPSTEKVENSYVVTPEWLPLRPQSEIMVEDSKKSLLINGLNLEETRLFEMINHNHSDEIMRALSFFSHARKKLSQHRFRSLFDLFVNHISALEVQLRERPEIIRDLGRFFSEVCNSFLDSGDDKTCLWLTKIGNELLAHCLHINEEAAAYFPDFRSLIRDHIACESAKKSGNSLIISYSYLVSSYISVAPDSLSEEERNQAICDIARLAYAENSSKWRKWKADIAIQSHAVFYLWEPHIREALNHKPELRNRILNRILEDSGHKVSSLSEEVWSGSFPLFRRGGFQLDLDCHRSSSNEENDSLNSLLEKVARETGIKLTGGIRTSSSTLSFPEQELYLEYQGDEYSLVGRALGKQYRFLKPKEIDTEIQLSEGESLWVENDAEDPTILQMKGCKIQARYFTQGGDVITRKQICRDGKFLNVIPSSRCRHQLSLLSWFQPPDSIQLIADEDNHLKSIEFPELDLRFDIQENQAVSADGSTPGFRISKRQRCPALASYSRYLLLENDQGDRKVHIAAAPLSQLAAKFYMTRFGQISSSSLIDSLLENFLSNLSQSEALYTFSLNSEGKLETRNPEALLYLTFLHFAEVDLSKCLDYFIQLEDLGKRYPYSQQIMSSLDVLILLLMLSKEPEAEELLLRISSVREENFLLQQNKKEKENVFLQGIRWVAVQSKYMNYLKRINDGAAPYLSETDELFILKSLSRQSAMAIKKMIPNDFFLAQFGRDFLADNVLMAPIIAERAHHLKEIYGECNAAQKILYDQIFGENEAAQINFFSQFTIPELSNLIPVEEYSYQSNLFKKVTTLFNQCVNNPLLKHPIKRNDWLTHQKLGFMKLEDVQTGQAYLTPEYISRNAVHFYRIALKKLPSEWEGDPEMEMLFNRQIEEFYRNFPLFRGKVSNPWEGVILECLRTIFDTPSLVSYPDPDELDRLLKQSRKFDELENRLKALYKEGKDNIFFNRAVSGHRITSMPDDARILVDEYNNIVEMQESLLEPDNKILQRPGVLFSRYLVHIISQCKKNRGTNAAWIRVKGTINTDSGWKLGLKTARVAAQWALDWGTGLGALKRIERYVNLGLKLFHNIDVPQTIKSIETANPPQILPSDLAVAMTRREKTINALFDSFFERYFDIAELPDGIQYRIKMGESFKEVGHDLTLLQRQVSEGLENERKKIAAFANRRCDRGETEAEILLKRLDDFKFQKKPLNFEEVDNAFIHDDDQWLMDRSSMGPEQLAILKKRLYLYHVGASRWHLFFDQIAGLNKASEEALDKVGRELCRRRVYDFEGKPEKLIRGKLVFESRTRKMLWKKQSDQIDRMLLSGQKRQVVELIMGSGKTWYGIPQTDYFSADGDRLMINIWPAPVAKTNISTIGTQARRVFSQTASAMGFSRSMNWARDKLWGLFHAFDRTRTEKEQLNMTKESLQALELCFIEQALDIEGKFKQKSDWKESLKYFQKTLRLIRTNGKGNIDEAHKAFERKKELNHPLGKAKRLDEDYVKVMEDIIFSLISSPEFEEILTIKTAKPSPLPQAEYKEKILPLLAEKTVRIPSLNIDEEHRESLTAYLKGEIDEVPEYVKSHSERSAIGLAKGMLTVLLPSALEKTINVDYGVSKEENGEYARPSEGNDNPSEVSTIRSPFEALVKSGLLLAHRRLNGKQLDKFIKKLKASAKCKAASGGGEASSSVEALFFRKHCPGYDLFTFTDDDREEVYRLLNQSDQVVLSYLRIFVAKQIRYFGLNLSSNASNFGSMFASFYSDTGTPYNKGSYPVGTVVLHDAGTNEESIDVMESRVSSIEILDEEDPDLVLDELIRRHFDDDPSATALIDRGAALNGISDIRVAKKLLDYIEERRPDKDGIAFYHKGEQVIWEKGASGPVTPEQSTIPMDKRLSYFPQPQTFAADIPQPEGALGIVSIGEDITFNELAQAIWRMRGLKRSGQHLKFVMTKRVRDKISDGRTPTVAEVIAFSQENENRMQKEDNYEADKQKLSNILRRAVLDKVLNSDIDLAIKIARAFKDVLVKEVASDPYKLFGLIDDQVSPKMIFARMRKAALDRVHNSSYFSEEEKEGLRLQLEAIGRGQYPDKVHTYRDGCSISSGGLDDIGKESQIAVDHEEETEEESETELRQNIELHFNQHQQGSKRALKAQIFSPWPKDVNPTALDWFQVTAAPSIEDSRFGFFSMQNLKSLISQKTSSPHHVPIYSLQDALQKAGREETQNISGKVSSTIYASNNIIHLMAQNGCPIEPFGQGQIPLLEALVVQKGNGNTKIILVDQKEAAFWRKKLAEDRAGKYASDPNVKIGLYDITLGALVAEGANRFTNELERPLFKRACIQLKFLRGDVLYTEDEAKVLKRWLKTRLQDFLSYFEYVYSFHRKNRYEGSILHRTFIELESEKRNFGIRV